MRPVCSTQFQGLHSGTGEKDPGLTYTAVFAEEYQGREHTINGKEKMK